MQPKPPRPTGVSVLAILAILFGLGGLALGAVLLAASAVVSTLNLSTTYPQLAMYNLTTATIAAVIGIFGAFFLIVGILDLIVGIGFFGGKGWGWTLGMIVGILNIVGGVLGIFVSPGAGIVWLIIWIGIVYYLTRPRVKTFFGRGVPMMTPPSMGPGTMSSMGTSTMGTGTGSMMHCRSCGASIPAGATKCPSCGASVM